MTDEMGLAERLTYFHFNNVEADRATLVTIETAALRDANDLFVSAAVALKTAQQQLAAKDAAIERLVAENRALTEALTPSGNTKAEYAGEFTIAVERMVNDDEEADDTGDVDPYDHIAVPWTTIKQIMAAISARARQALGDT